jgi:hypothetical protein
MKLNLSWRSIGAILVNLGGVFLVGLYLSGNVSSALWIVGGAVLVGLAGVLIT